MTKTYRHTDLVLSENRGGRDGDDILAGEECGCRMNEVPTPVLIEVLLCHLPNLLHLLSQGILIGAVKVYEYLCW